jgi:PIN domain nuclease of toxin-antitoxin system
LLISIISIWEVGLLESKGRLDLNGDCEQWIEEALAMPGLSLVPLTREIALDCTRLPGTLHGDPPTASSSRPLAGWAPAC